ncbi:MAG: tetratricopeptide repeat protein [Magnetococcales bacterium]|nr:tetratricopeptide repeat protein [Magnetococcales bacterium]
MASHTRPDYWLAPLWPNGGDMASHLLYVGVFQEWFLHHAKMTGWMPEVFAGFPAFLHYFPFPFMLIALLSLVAGLPLAFKAVILLPILTLPAAICWSTGRLGWPWAARLLAAAAGVGFLLNEGSTIWGGNILAQMGGEFAFGWGLLAVILYVGSLAQFQRQGGRGWLLAALLAEMASAMSHGFAILVVGFGSLLYLLLAGGGWRACWLLLRLHLLAFLLLGFWLLPLLANLPWSIPNDTAYFITRKMWLNELWPASFWWLGWGLPIGLIWLVRSGPFRPAGLPFLSMGLLGLIGFFWAPRLGLADVRFLPYGQLGFSLLLAGALGWWLAGGCRLQCRLPATAAVQRFALAAAILLTAGLASYWDLSIVKVPEWSWNLFAGYEGRPQWSFYRQLANQLRGRMDEPRVLFEHDLANNDLGSTRTLEALPFFGTRPVLEGLYMESAISAPFIYQLQAEVSAHPSGPLSRYPPLEGTVTAAVQHMRELGADTLVLRSAAMKARFGNDDRFQREAEIGPFLLLRLRQETPLLALLEVPVQAEGRVDWLDLAYRRFLLDFPYVERKVFLQAGESLPPLPAHCAGGTVRLERLQRERLEIRTDRPGCPLLVRMSYHPKWRALSGETIYLVEPFFMLLFPRGEQVSLAYLPNGADQMGALLTALGGVWLLVLLMRSVGRPCQAVSPPVVVAGYPLGMGLAAVLLLAGWWYGPDRGYQAGHALFNQGRFTEAAQLLDQAVEERRGWSRHGEALFWAGMAWERGGHPQEAAWRYHQLMERYPAGMFTAEAIHRLIGWYRQQGEVVQARRLLDHLKSHYPASRWLRRTLAVVSAP